MYAPDLASGLDVQPQGRFIEKQHPGLVNQARCDIQSLAHAARIGLDRIIGTGR